jgi:hypothetical protein
MFWRVCSALVVLFWAVMTGLLLRDTYFPEESRFTGVAPRMVWDLFLNQSEHFNTTLHLYQDKERIGHASFQVTRSHGEGEPVYELFATGVVEKAEGDLRRSDITWRGMVDLANGERCTGLDVIGRWLTRDVSVAVRWKPGMEPDLEVRQGDQLVMDSTMARSMMAMGGGGLLPVDALPQLGGLSLTAREGSIKLAGRDRKCFVMTIRMGEAIETEAVFTEVGELAMVRLPEGYQLLEPTVFGLQEEDP